jgi:hypothetical protein
MFKRTAVSTPHSLLQNFCTFNVTSSVSRVKVCLGPVSRSGQPWGTGDKLTVH